MRMYWIQINYVREEDNILHVPYSAMSYRYHVCNAAAVASHKNIHHHHFTIFHFSGCLYANDVCTQDEICFDGKWEKYRHGCRKNQKYTFHLSHTYSLIKPLLCNVQHQAIYYTKVTYNDKLGSSLLFKFSHKLQSKLVPHVGCKLDIHVMKAEFCVQWYSSAFYLLLRCMHIGQGLNFKRRKLPFSSRERPHIF